MSPIIIGKPIIIHHNTLLLSFVTYLALWGNAIPIEDGTNVPAVIITRTIIPVWPLTLGGEI